MINNMEERMKALQDSMQKMQQAQTSARLGDKLDALKNSVDQLKDARVKPVARLPVNRQPSAEPVRPIPGQTKPVAGITGSQLTATVKKDLLKRLMVLVQKDAGIMLGPQHEDKLMRKALELVDESRLANWVADLELRPTHPQRQELIERLTVHETYFYRDSRQLEGIRDTVFSELISRRNAMQIPNIRIWSAASSTGEEPYTVLIMLLEALLKAGQAVEPVPGKIETRWKIEVMGSDISRMAITRAREGKYDSGTLGSFRGMPNTMMRFFDQHNGVRANEMTFQVMAPLRRMCQFAEFNLNNREQRPLHENIDVVFCRNVLIYFDRKTKTNVQEMLHKSLRSGGILVMGPTDTLEVPQLFDKHQGSGYLFYVKK